MTRGTHCLRMLPLLSALALAACSSPPVAPPTSAQVVGERRSGYLHGYLAAEALPDSLALLAPPPTPDSAAGAADVAAFRSLTALRGTARGALATADAQLRFPQAANAFSCALGVPISEQDAPHLTMLMRRTLTDAGLATYKAKDTYVRQRPFVMLKAASCTPDQEVALAKDGSYPSGHAAIGWAWALVLSQVAPSRTDLLLQRGRSFGQSRGICGVHWQSDIEAGRLMGAATVARLQTHPVFVAQLEAAQREVAKLQARNTGSAVDCAVQAAAQAEAMQLAP